MSVAIDRRGEGRQSLLAGVVLPIVLLLIVIAVVSGLVFGGVIQGQRSGSARAFDNHRSDHHHRTLTWSPEGAGNEAPCYTPLHDGSWWSTRATVGAPTLHNRFHCACSPVRLGCHGLRPATSCRSRHNP